DRPSIVLARKSTRSARFPRGSAVKPPFQLRRQSLDRRTDRLHKMIERLGRQSHDGFVENGDLRFVKGGAAHEFRARQTVELGAAINDAEIVYSKAHRNGDIALEGHVNHESLQEEGCIAI